MRWGLSLLLVPLVISTLLPQQKLQVPLSTPVSSDDWGLQDWTAIRTGQLGLLHGRNGDQLQLYALGTSLSPDSMAPVISQRPAFSGNCFQVSTFDFGNKNRLGGFFNAFQKEPSSARASLQAGPDGRRGLTLDYLKTPSGFCGVWTHLFDFRLTPEQRRYFDSAPFSVLTFWIRSQNGTQRILLKAADARWERKGDALPIGDTASFLTQDKIIDSWQRVVVPLSRFPQTLNRRELASIVFEPLDNRIGQIQIKDLTFCADPLPLPELSLPVTRVTNSKPSQKALWVWNTSDLLAHSGLQDELLRFLRTQRFTRVFLQLPEGRVRGTVVGELTLDPDRLRPLLSRLNGAGVSVAALDGFKNYALPDWHDGVLRTVENVIRYNQESGPLERFSGIHYDVEPYLLKGFTGPRRQSFLQGYLDLVEKISRKTNAAGTVFGVDIPFWYDEVDEFTRKPFSIAFRGVTKPASEHVIDLVDEVTIMDYRTAAYGADGVIAMAQDELAYASKQGKSVFVGLETTELPDEELVTFGGAPSDDLARKIPQSRFVVLARGKSAANLYLVTPAQWPAVRAELESLGVDLASLLWWPVQNTTFVPGRRLTFFNLGNGPLLQTIAEAQSELSIFPAFAGFAIHDYLGYSRLVQPSPQSPR